MGKLHTKQIAVIVLQFKDLAKQKNNHFSKLSLKTSWTELNDMQSIW